MANCLYDRSAPTLLFLAFIFLTACESSREISQSKGILGKTGEGSVGQALTVNEKCSQVVDWIDKFKDEYPNFNFQYGGFVRISETANLYRDSSFKPRFGITYEQKNATELREINQNVLRHCYVRSGPVDKSIRAQLLPIKPFLDRGFNFDQSLERLVKQRNTQEAWFKKTLLEISAIPNTPEGFSNLETNYFSIAIPKALGLWPSEQRTLKSMIQTRRIEVARQVLINTIPNPTSLETSTHQANRLFKLEPYVKVLKASEDLNDRALGGRYEEKLKSMGPPLIAEKEKELIDIPSDIQGLGHTQNWLEAFERDFSPAFSNTPEYRRTFSLLFQKREDIFRANKEKLLKQFDALKGTEDRERKHQVLMSKTFPLESDRTTSFYKEFQKELYERQKSDLRKLFDKGLLSLKELHEAIKDLAEDIVSGSPENER